MAYHLKVLNDAKKLLEKYPDLNVSTKIKKGYALRYAQMVTFTPLQLTHSDPLTPTTVLVDGLWLGHDPYAVHLPLVLKAYTSP